MIACNPSTFMEMPVGDLVAHAESVGLKFGLTDGKIKVGGPARVLDQNEPLRLALRARRDELVNLLNEDQAERSAIQTIESETTSTTTSPTAHLRGPRRTPWGTRVWSDPNEPLPIESFGPCR